MLSSEKALNQARLRPGVVSNLVTGALELCSGIFPALICTLFTAFPKQVYFAEWLSPERPQTHRVKSKVGRWSQRRLYGKNPWKNVLSIGDSVTEKTAITELQLRCFSFWSGRDLAFFSKSAKALRRE